jgi:hypothetical protein
VNRYKLHEPRLDIALPGEEVWFKSFTASWVRGTVRGYRDGKYTIAIAEDLSFYYNVTEVVKISEEPPTPTEMP